MKTNGFTFNLLRWFRRKKTLEPSEDNKSSQATDFEKTKYWIELAKWIVGTAGLSIITLIINTGFTDRQHGLDEMKFYDKYVSEIIVNNKEPYKRYYLAQFYSCVNVTDEIREGWERYRVIIYPEYKQDSTRREHEYSRTSREADSLNAQIENIRSDTSKNKDDKKLKILTDEYFQKIETIKNLNNIREGKFNIVLPQTKSAAVLEGEGFTAIINKDVEAAITAFESLEAAFPKYHSAFEIGNYLKTNRTKLADKNSTEWKAVIKFIVENYSIGMSDDTKNQMKAQY
jgi:hypothetical protein